jgi:AraC-like DNA-binding protein
MKVRRWVLTGQRRADIGQENPRTRIHFSASLRAECHRQSEIVMNLASRKETILASRVLRIVDALRLLGLDVVALSVEAGLDLRKLTQPGERCQVDTVRALWEVAVRTSGNEDVGLLAACVCHPAGLDLLEYAMMSCPTLGCAIDLVVRYSRIADDSIDYLCLEQAEGLRVVFGFDVGQRPAPRQNVEFAMLASLNFCRWIVGGKLTPLRVWLTHCAPIDPGAHQTAFQCQITFGAPFNGILLSHTDLELCLLTHNAQLAQLLERWVEENVAWLDQGQNTTRTSAQIRNELPFGEPNRKQVAKALYMSNSTLGRRLRAEGSTFHQLLDSVRKEIAVGYLGESDMSLVEIASLLGYSEQSSLARATRRWFNKTPRALRAELRQLRTADVAGDD